jgi:hypothetical protein
MNDQLALRIRRPLKPATNAEMAEVKTWAKAMQRAADLSGIGRKALAVDIEMDEGQFSKTLGGQLGVMPDKLCAFMDACGSEFPLMWLNHQRGYDVEAMRQRETELQQQLRAEREEKEALKRELATITKFVREARAA